MTRNEIIEVLKNGVSEIFNDAIVDVTVYKKNNAQKKIGISIRYNKHNFEVAPIIYIDDIIEDIEDNTISVCDGVEMIANIYDKAKADIRLSINRDMILENLKCVVINYEMNEEYLQTVPHRRYLDLAIMYRFTVTIDKIMECHGSIAVSNEIMTQFNLSLGELDYAARNNIYEEDFRVLSLCDLIGESSSDVLPDDMFLNVLTDSAGCYGARTILNKKLLASFGMDLYIIPSSIYEIIVFPANPLYRGVRETIREVNGTLDPSDILSDNLYYYNHNKNCITIVTD